MGVALRARARFKPPALQERVEFASGAAAPGGELGREALRGSALGESRSGARLQLVVRDGVPRGGVPGGRARENDDGLASPILPSGEGGESASRELFMELRQLARDAGLPGWRPSGELDEGRLQARRRLEQHDGLRASRDALEQLRASFAAAREEAREPKRAVDETRERDGRWDRARPREAFERQAGLDHRADEPGARVADARHPGVRDERNARACGHEAEHAGKVGVRGVGRKRDEPTAVDLEMRKQLPRAARVLGRDDRDAPQRVERPERDVTEVTDRCADEQERARAGVRGVGRTHGASYTAFPQPRRPCER